MRSVNNVCDYRLRVNVAKYAKTVIDKLKILFRYEYYVVTSTQVILGDNNVNNASPSRRVFTALRFIKHSSYSITTHTQDIALVEVIHTDKDVNKLLIKIIYFSCL